MADDRFHHCTRSRLRRWRKRGAKIQALGRSKGGYSTKIHLSVDALGNPLEFILSPGAASDCPLGVRLIEGRNPDYVLADRGYDSERPLHNSINFRKNILYSLSE